MICDVYNRTPWCLDNAKTFWMRAWVKAVAPNFLPLWLFGLNLPIIFSLFRCYCISRQGKPDKSKGKALHSLEKAEWISSKISQAPTLGAWNYGNFLQKAVLACNLIFNLRSLGPGVWNILQLQVKSNTNYKFRWISLLFGYQPIVRDHRNGKKRFLRQPLELKN